MSLTNPGRKTVTTIKRGQEQHRPVNLVEVNEQITSSIQTGHYPTASCLPAHHQLTGNGQISEEGQNCIDESYSGKQPLPEGNSLLALRFSNPLLWSVAFHLLIVLIAFKLCPVQQYLYSRSTMQTVVVSWSASDHRGTDAKPNWNRGADGHSRHENSVNSKRNTLAVTQLKHPSVSKGRTHQHQIAAHRAVLPGSAYGGASAPAVISSTADAPRSTSSVPAVKKNESRVMQPADQKPEQSNSELDGQPSVEPEGLPSAVKSPMSGSTSAAAAATRNTDSNFATNPFEWYIQTPDLRASYHFGEEGELILDDLKKDKNFNQHSHMAWRYMEQANFCEKRAQTARLRGNLAEYEKWHGLSRAPIKKSINELKLYLETLKPGNEQLFHTYYNLASCYAMAGEPEQALKYYEEYEKIRPHYWTSPFGRFCIGTILITQDKFDEAKQILLTTVTAPDKQFQWSEYNEDGEYRVITWELIAHIEKLQGHASSAAEALQESHRALAPITNRKAQNGGGKTSLQWIQDFLNRMGIESSIGNPD